MIGGPGAGELSPLTSGTAGDLAGSGETISPPTRVTGSGRDCPGLSVPDTDVSGPVSRFVEWMRISADSSNATGGQPATSTPAALHPPAAATFAASDTQIPAVNATRTTSRTHPRASESAGSNRARLARINNPSTLSGHTAAATPRAPCPSANAH